AVVTLERKRPSGRYGHRNFIDRFSKPHSAVPYLLVDGAICVDDLAGARGRRVPRKTMIRITDVEISEADSDIPEPGPNECPVWHAFEVQRYFVPVYLRAGNDKAGRGGRSQWLTVRAGTERREDGGIEVLPIHALQ
ncbi:MAG TPA: hypothetical protein VK358_01245, partial [Longimicrobium sp.]|nr:hypothetical protein [Longimicrobium sp.]